jgi:hypothetical protein
VVGGDASAAGGSATFTGAAVFGVVAGDALADGGVANFLQFIHFVANARRLEIVRAKRRHVVVPSTAGNRADYAPIQDRHAEGPGG